MEQLFKKIGILLLGLAIGVGTGLLSHTLSGASSGSGGLPMPAIFGIAVILAGFLFLKINLSKVILTYAVVFGAYLFAVCMGILSAMVFRGAYTAAGSIAGGTLLVILLPLVVGMRRRNWMIAGLALLALASIGVEWMIAGVEGAMEAQRHGAPYRPGITEAWVYWNNIIPAIWQSLMLGFMVVQLYEERLRRKAAGHLFA
jgi:hypothetical protein